MLFPCKDCPRRYPGCHGKCDDYQTAKSEHDRIRNAEYTRRCNEAYSIDLIRSRRDRMAKRRKASGGIRRFEH